MEKRVEELLKNIDTKLTKMGEIIKETNLEDKDSEGFMEDTEDKDEPDELFPYKARTDEELKELAMSLYRNEIFIDRQIQGEHNNHLYTTIFMPLIFMEEDRIKWMEDNNINLLYGKYTDAMPRGINGYPMFHSIGMLNKEDAERFMEKYNKIVDTMENV